MNELKHNLEVGEANFTTKGTSEYQGFGEVYWKDEVDKLLAENMPKECECDSIHPSTCKERGYKFCSYCGGKIKEVK